MPKQVTAYCIDKPTCFIEKQELKQVFKQVIYHYSRHFHTLFVKCYRVLSPEGEHALYSFALYRQVQSQLAQ